MGSPGILSSVLVVELFDDSRVNILCMTQTNVELFYRDSGDSSAQATCFNLYVLRTYKVVFSPQSPRIWAHGHIFKMAAGGGKEVLEENIEQQLFRIVKGQLFSKILFISIPCI